MSGVSLPERTTEEAWAEERVRMEKQRLLRKGGGVKIFILII